MMALFAACSHQFLHLELAKNGNTVNEALVTYDAPLFQCYAM